MNNVVNAQPDPDCPYCKASKSAIEGYAALDRKRHTKFLQLVDEYQKLEVAVRDLYYQDGDFNKKWIDAITAVRWLKNRME